METNLPVGVQAVSEPREVEKELIALACPPLNPTLWSNPGARKACLEIARGSKQS
jgi:hypothetical protein